ncbi:MAG TPA: S41 family peptidase [Candidatus Acidoferrum sp.]
MKYLRASVLLSLVILLAGAAWAKEIRIPRQPDLHNGKIVFSYLGSIWVVNEDGSNPRRLTVNPARDTFPRFSPDGKWIAFSSNRYGNNDVFLMPTGGGEPKQLTFNSANDTVVGWSRDSKYVLFNSSRGRIYPGVLSLYAVSVEGGLEEPLNTDWGYWGSYSADNAHFVFNRHTPIWWRKHYRGSNASDLWIEDLKAKSFRKILDQDVPDEMKATNNWPMYVGSDIYFVSDREVSGKSGSREVMRSTNNIWKVSDNGGKPVQITHFKDGSLFFPSVSADGKVIVFEEDFGLWKLDTTTGKTSEVKIDITTEDKENNFEVLTVNNEADSYHLSPSGQRVAISTHGEIFTVAAERGDVTQVTRSYARDIDPAWSPDGKWIAYVSDQDGQDAVWVADAEGKNAKKLTNTDNEKLNVAWMPDSKAVYFTSSDHGLYVVEAAGGQAKKIASNDSGNIQEPHVSPDGKWFAYAKQDHDFRAHVYITSVSGEEHRLNDEIMFSTLNPRWTPDGRRLIFLGGHVQGGSAALRENSATLYSVSLSDEDKNPMSRDIDNEAEGEAADRSAADRGAAGRGGRGAGGAAGGGEPRTVEVKIDFNGLERRVHRVTRMTENIASAVPSPDSRTYAFVAVTEGEGRPSSTLYVIGADGDGLRQVTQAMPPDRENGDTPPPAAGGMGGGGISRLQFSRDGRSIYFMERNGIWAVSLGGGGADAVAAPAGGRGGAAAGGTAAAGTRRRVNFRVRVEVDHRAEREEVFEQAWRVMRDRFYDKNMNGVDWAKYREMYEPLLENVGDREEMQSVIVQMIGELNASHTGVSGGEPNPNAMQTRYPGFDLERDSSGYYKVAFVYKDGPADHDFVRIHVGDFILAVDGQPLHSGDNYWRLYNLAPGRKFEFTVNSKPSTEGAWTTKVEPVNAGAFGTLQYDRWVEERRAMTEKLSHGEIGYLHIRQMNAESLHKFERDLADNHFKKALVIDQRFNPGGGIDEELLEILQQHQYQYTRGRDSVYVTRPQRAFFGPIAVMQNERSFSDAEVFPDGVRRLGLGKTVGTNTNGSVIGTGAFRLLDGSTVRTPGSGLWDISGQNLENYGVPADVYVDNSPADFLAGRDAQLEKAVQVLQEELKKNPPKEVPGR